MANYMKPSSKKDNSKTYKIAGLVILVLLIIILALFLFRSCSAETPVQNDSAVSGLVYDSNATEGGWDEADTDAIIAGLNEKVEEGMINISMNTSPVFEDGTSEGNLMIVNEGINNYPQVVEITRNDKASL